MAPGGPGPRAPGGPRGSPGPRPGPHGPPHAARARRPPTHASGGGDPGDRAAARAEPRHGAEPHPEHSDETRGPQPPPGCGPGAAAPLGRPFPVSPGPSRRGPPRARASVLSPHEAGPPPILLRSPQDRIRSVEVEVGEGMGDPGVDPESDEDP